MTSPLVRLHSEFGQSPWYDNLTRELVLDGGLAGFVADGIRGVTSNPTIFDKAMGAGNRYDEQMLECSRRGRSIEDTYWALVVDDITHATDELRGRAAVANARLAYQLFRDRFSGPRWEALAAKGARLQRPLWASTSTKDPAYPPTLYVDELVGPDTVNTMAPASIE